VSCKIVLVEQHRRLKLSDNLWLTFKVLHTNKYVSGVFFKFHLIVGVEESIVNALYRFRIADQLFKSYLLHEWCVHNRLFNAYYEVKLKKKHWILHITKCL
jgi:hypothetical protein